MRRLFFACALVIATILGGIFSGIFGATPASAGSRVALVIGNSAYENVPFLPNPINDAADLSIVLKRMDFSVKTLTNVRYDEMRRELIAFGEQASGADIALIYFAGHGIEMGSENWVIPIDARLRNRSQRLQ